MPKRKTAEQFKEEVNNYTCGEIEILNGEYQNKESWIEFKHKECGETFKKRASNFLTYLKCPCCGKEFDLNIYFQIYNQEDFENKLYELVGDEFKLIDDYVDNDTKVKIKHIECDNIREVLPLKFLMNPICLYCRGGLSLTHEYYANKFYKRYGKEYVLVSNYVNSKLPVKIVHTKCGTEFDFYVKDFDNLKCSKCDDIDNITKKFRQVLGKLTDNDFDLIGRYNKDKIKILHKTCRSTFEINPKEFMKTLVCPKCERGFNIGTKRISKYLDSKNKIYLQYYNINSEDYNFKFDFAVFKDGDLKCLIDYYDEYHYIPINSGNDKDSNNKGNDNNNENNNEYFNYIRNEDKKKAIYCEKNKIKYIAIPFWKINNVKEFMRYKV